MTTDFTPLFALNDRVRTNTQTSRFSFTPAKVGTVIKLKRRYALVQFDGQDAAAATWFSQRTGSQRNGTLSIRVTDDADIEKVRAYEAELAERKAEEHKARDAQQARRARLAELTKEAFLALDGELVQFTPLSSTWLAGREVVIFAAKSLRDREEAGLRIFTLIFAPSTEIDYEASSARRREAKAAAEMMGVEISDEDWDATYVYRKGWSIVYNSVAPDDTSSGHHIRFVEDRIDGVVALLDDHFINSRDIELQLRDEEAMSATEL